ncbi:MAG: PQQ-binding-like beta-propeller repeat protein [Candidatus Eremiobacteraeota bacterium]|nr:PQQ-binding-like beta-propeller repeat protein [Candidatus Eremiobacteraeota bacterium]
MQSRREIALLLTLALIGTAPAPAPSPQRFDAARTLVWDQFRHGHGLNDVVVNSNVPDRVAWRFDAPQKGTSTSPVVAGTTILISGNDHTLYAVDARDGRPVWRWKGDNEIMTAPVYRDGIAVVGTGNADSPVWDPPIYNVVGMGSSDLNAIDLRTGNRLWSFALTGTGMPMPALVGNHLLHVDGSGVFLALDVRSGTYLWRRLLYSNASMTNILVSGGLAYFGGRFLNVIYALRSDDGHVEWSHPFPQRDGAFDDCPLATDGQQIFGMYATPRTPDPKVFVVAGVVARQHVYALDAKTGRLRWDSALAVTGPEPTYNESAIPLYAGGLVYDGSPVAPIVTALDARNGRPRWSLHVSGPVKGGLVVRDGVLYFGDLGGKLWAVDAKTGRVIGSLQTDLRFNVGSPIILNDSLVDGSVQGPVIAVPLANIRSSQPVAGVTAESKHDFTLLLVIAVLAALASGQFVSRRRPASR